jgi:hypothetical protein
MEDFPRMQSSLAQRLSVTSRRQGEKSKSHHEGTKTRRKAKKLVKVTFWSPGTLNGAMMISDG